MTRRVVRDQVHGNAGLHQFPRGQARTLQSRPRFVYPDMQRVALFPGRAHHTQRCAIIDRCQRTRVAVVQNVGAVRHHRRAVGAHAPVDLNVLVGKALCLGQQGGRDVVQWCRVGVARQLQQPARGPRQIDRRGASVIQNFLGISQI